MISVRFDDSFEGWRLAARSLVADGIQPDEVEWIGGSAQESIFGSSSGSIESRTAPFPVPADFLRLAETVACFREPDRWSLLYRVLWRLTHGERSLMNIVVDRDVHRMQRMASAVRRDAHKMTAFVRFRRIGEDEESARYIAWFTPAHLILERVAPFFAHRFASMYWSILTPDGSIHWNREQLAFGPALDRASAPATDELETLWRTYYSSIFNPARLKLSAMRSEMPKKYWVGLPEAQLIPELVADARARVKKMGVPDTSA